MSKVLAILISLVGFTFFSVSASAQPYPGSIGLRAGSANGLSVQAFMGHSHSSVEGLLVYRRGGARVIGLLTQYVPLGGRGTDTYFYFGLGGHVGMNGFFHQSDYNRPVAGVDAIAGFMYQLPYAPLAIRVDLKPMVELWGTRTLSGNNAGITLSYILD